MPIQRYLPVLDLPSRGNLLDQNKELDTALLRSENLVFESFVFLKQVGCKLRYSVLGVYGDITLACDLVISNIEGLPDDFYSLPPAVLLNVLVLSFLLTSISIENRGQNGSSSV